MNEMQNSQPRRLRLRHAFVFYAGGLMLMYLAILLNLGGWIYLILYLTIGVALTAWYCAV